MTLAVDEVIRGADALIEAVGQIRNGIAYLHERRLLHSVLGHLGEVARCSIVLGVVQTVGRCEMSIVTAQLSRLAVHEVYKAADAVADVIRKHEGRVVAGREHEAVQEVAYRKALADVVFETHHRALGIEVIEGFFGYEHCRTVDIADVLGNDDVGHDLCGRSRIYYLVTVMLIHDCG